MRRAIRWVLVVLWGLELVALSLQARAGRWYQEFSLGMKPPYHWVTETNGIPSWSYVDTRGRECGCAYGLGFAYDGPDREAALQTIRNHCDSF